VSTFASGTAILMLSCTVKTAKLPFVSLASNAIASDAKLDVWPFWQDANAKQIRAKKNNCFMFYIICGAVGPSVKDSTKIHVLLYC